MVQLALSFSIFTILAIGASRRLVSRSDTEVEKRSSTSPNIRGPISTSDDDADEINFDEDYEDLEDEEDLTLTFSVPSGRSAGQGVVKMTLKEINKIFNKKGFRGNKNRHLTRTDKMKARECRRKKKLYFRKTKKCHQPLAQGPCKTNTKWLVAVKGRLDGVCRERPCQSEATPIMYNGTCVSIDNDSCPPHSRLYLNKRGVAACDCEAGYSRGSDREGDCYRDFLPGPCQSPDSMVWLAGNCVPDPCPPGQIMWSEVGDDGDDDGGPDSTGECRPAEPGLADCEGDLVLAADTQTVTCEARPGLGRVITGNTRQCRRGQVWSSWRARCVRLFG